MLDKLTIAKILETSCRAPSGENCQPWRFQIQGNTIDIFNVPERDASLYNFKQHASLIAHGALMENILLCAPAFGYHAGISILPDQNNTNHTARVVLEKQEKSVINPLQTYIEKRHTNRKPYVQTKLTDDQKEELVKCSIEIGVGEILLVDDPIAKLRIAKALTVSDRMLFENKIVHDFLFSHISWTKEEIEKKRSGFYIKELELASPQEKAFKLFRNWNILRIFNSLGFAKLAANGNVKLYNASAAIGIITLDTNTHESFVFGGRIMERLWLKATKMGLSIQPITGVIFFAHRILNGETQHFSKNHVHLIKKAYKQITEEFQIKNQNIVMLFRIGQSNEPSSKSLRIFPIIE